MGIETRRSQIHGRGVFATTSFREGDLVVPWMNTREISAEESDQLPASERGFIDIQDDGKILLVGEPERYVNHSCEPNTGPGPQGDVAVRDIRSGEEITADYGQFFLPNGPFTCSCGQAKCRTLILGRKGVRAPERKWIPERK